MPTTKIISSVAAILAGAPASVLEAVRELCEKLLAAEEKKRLANEWLDAALELRMLDEGCPNFGD